LAVVSLTTESQVIVDKSGARRMRGSSIF